MARVFGWQMRLGDWVRERDGSAEMIGLVMPRIISRDSVCTRRYDARVVSRGRAL